MTDGLLGALLVIGLPILLILFTVLAGVIDRRRR